MGVYGTDDSPIGGHIVDSLRLERPANATIFVPTDRDGRGTGPAYRTIANA